MFVFGGLWDKILPGIEPQFLFIVCKPSITELISHPRIVLQNGELKRSPTRNRTLHTARAEQTHPSSAHRTFSRTNHMLNYRKSLNKSKRA